MGSLDVDSLFVNIPLDENIVICVNQLFKNIDTVAGFPKSEFKQLLCLATTNTLMLYLWAHLLNLPLLTLFCHTIKKTD